MNSKTLTKIAVVVLSITITAYAIEHIGQVQAQNKTDLTGTWKLNLTESKTQDGSPMSQLYESFVMTIDHKEPQLSIKQDIVQEGSRRTIALSVTTDGKESQSKILDAPATANAKWEGDTLTIHLKRELKEGGYVESIRSVKVSQDGKTMRAKVTINPSGIVGDEVWEKQ
jgi:hypothetical protein